MSKTNNPQTKHMQTSTAPKEDQTQRGQALLEFALVLMFVILPFTFVLVDGAIMLFTYAEVTNGAREAARAAAIYQYKCTGSPCATDPSNTFATYADQYGLIDAGRLAYVDSYFNTEDTRWLSALIGYSQCSRQITYPLNPPIDPVTNVPNPYREMDSLTLTLACPRRLLFGLVGTSQITLTASATMRIEPGGVAP